MASSARRCRSGRWSAWRGSRSTSTRRPALKMLAKLFLLRFLRRWHARIGFTAAVFFLFLAVTGLVLNHGTELGLDAKRVHSARLAHWYGVAAGPPRAAF